VFRRFSVPYLQLGGRKTCECAAAFKLSPNAIKAQLLGLGLEVRRILEDTTAHFLRIDDCSSGERRSAVKNSRHHPRPFQKHLTITPSPGKTSFGTEGRPGLPVSDLQVPEQAKAFPVPADDGRGFDDKDAGLRIVPDRA
jgi:hypothetical protein